MSYKKSENPDIAEGKRDNTEGKRDSVANLRENTVAQELSLPPAPKSKTSVLSNTSTIEEHHDMSHEQPVSTTK